jgi:hypothetical protein
MFSAPPPEPPPLKRRRLELNKSIDYMHHLSQVHRAEWWWWLEARPDSHQKKYRICYRRRLDRSANASRSDVELVTQQCGELWLGQLELMLLPVRMCTCNRVSFPNMRLLNTTTLALEEWSYHQQPEKYAILSHTWGDGVAANCRRPLRSGPY